MPKDKRPGIKIITPEKAFDDSPESYLEKFGDVKNYVNVLDSLCNRLPLHALVLDAACGPGNIAQYMIKKRKDLVIDFMDLSRNMISLCKSRFPGSDCYHLDLRKMSSLSKSYHAILIGFGLPYLTIDEAAECLHNCCNKIEPDGYLYLSTMTGDYSRSGLIKKSSSDEWLMTYYYSEELLRRLLDESGFEVTHLEHQRANETPELVLIARKV